MATVREIEARLSSEVEDRVLERLGYREVTVKLPGGDVVAPNPKAKEMSSSEQRRTFSEQILSELGGTFRPAIIWRVEIPRVYRADQIRVEGPWVLNPGEGEESITTVPVSIIKGDARWTVYLTPQRRTGLLQ